MLEAYHYTGGPGPAITHIQIWNDGLVCVSRAARKYKCKFFSDGSVGRIATLILDEKLTGTAKDLAAEEIAYFDFEEIEIETASWQATIVIDHIPAAFRELIEVLKFVAEATLRKNIFLDP